MDTNLAFQIVGVVLGANAVFFALIIWFLERDRSRLKTHVDLLEKHVGRTDSMVDSLVNWMVSSDKMSKIDEALAIHLARGTATKQYLECTSGARKSIKNELSRHREELMLHCSDQEWRDSAYRTLANGLGNFKSLEIMQNLARLEPDGEHENNYFRVVLKRRLVHLLSTHPDS